MDRAIKHNILVIGGAGFIGSHLTTALLEAGHRVLCLDVKPPAIRHERLQWVEGSFIHREKINEVLEGCDVVYHLASATVPKTSNDDPAFDINSNLIGTTHLLQCAVQNRIRKLIFTSSGGTVYGRPDSLPVSEASPTQPLCSYGIVKLAIEKYLFMFHHLHGLNACVLRLSNPYGENQRPDTGQGVIAAFCHKAMSGQPIEIWGDGSVIRDYIHIADVTDAMIKAMYVDCGGQVLNIGSGQGTSLNEIIVHIETTCGQVIDRIYQKSRPFDVPAIYLDISAAAKKLDWRPRTPLDEGIGHLIHSIRRNAA